LAYVTMAADEGIGPSLRVSKTLALPLCKSAMFGCWD
jgi:hypothetical protein